MESFFKLFRIFVAITAPAILYYSFYIWSYKWLVIYIVFVVAMDIWRSRWKRKNNCDQAEKNSLNT